MRILITGGLGYIGGRIAEYCRAKSPGCEIILAVWKGFESFPKWTKDFTVVPLELQEDRSVEKCVTDAVPDCIIHLAALNEIDSKRDSDLAYEVNCRGTERLLRVASKNGVKKFIYFSTFHVYNREVGAVITEQTPTRPTHPYAMTHLAAEEMVKLFRDKGMGTLIFRLSNSYGYPMDKNVNRWTLVVNDLCRQLVNFGRISLKTSGKQHRDFISLHDVSRAVHHFIFSVPDAWNNDVYNLGGECTMSILNMAETIARIYAQESGKEPGGISLAEGNNGDIGDIKYNIDKLKNTGFHLEGNMSYEIKKTLKLCEEMKRKSELEKDTNNVKAG